MSNIFSQSISPEFTKQSLTEFFVDPMFMGEDIRGAITVRTDIKGTEKLNNISRPSMITKPKTTPGFTANGSFALTTTDITVKPMAIEFEQNGEAFWGSILQEMLAQGYKQDDVEQMKSPDVWNKIMLPIIAQAGQQDLIRQMWFADATQQTLSATYFPTGVVNTNYTGYSGFFYNFIQASRLGTIPDAQIVDMTVASAGTAQVQVETLTISDGTATITINGIAYVETFDTNAATTATAWLASHKATIEALWGTHAVVLTDDESAAITITAKYAGAKFLAVASASDGSWEKSGVVAAVKPGALSTDSVDTALEAMIDAMPAEMLELEPVFMMTRAAYRNLLKTWKALTTETANMISFNGITTPSYEGIPILIRPDWDLWITALGGVFPNRVVLTPAKNLLFGTDGLDDSEMIESWYNQDDQMRRYRVQYKAQTAFLHSELVVLGGMPTY